MALAMYETVLANFPKKNLRLAFAYGSGVFRQQGHEDKSKNMLDFMFVVDDPVAWHRENMQRNYSHYSFLKVLGPKYLARIQDRYGAGVYFNTLVPCQDRLIKYGVLSRSRLLADLFDWDTLYVAGRLQKPVRMLVHEKDNDVDFALLANLQNAIHTSLLMLPEYFTEKDLYRTITSLSYSGDFRMTIGEDKNKVQNIVTPNMEHFRQLYETLLDKEEHLHWNKSQGTFVQHSFRISRYHHLNLLPKTLLSMLVMHRNSDGRNRDSEEVIRSLAADDQCDEIVHKCVSAIVKTSSLTQSIKSIFTAGFKKSVKYGGQKMKKMMKSTKK